MEPFDPEAELFVGILIMVVIIIVVMAIIAV